MKPNIRNLASAFFIIAYTQVSFASVSMEQPISKSKYFDALKADFALYQQEQSGQENQSSVLSTALGINSLSSLTDSLSLKFKAKIYFATGTSQSKYGNNRLTGKNGTSLKDAFINWTPVKGLNLKAGAINQKIQRNLLVVGRKAFIGLDEMYKYTYDHHSLTFRATQSRPKSESKTEGLGEIDEGTPLFFRESLTYEVNYLNTNTRFSVGHFAYDRLSTDAAYNSIFLGNTVDGQTPSNSSFAYNFVGWDGELTTRIDVTNNLELHASAILSQNSGAPAEKNFASSYAIGSVYSYNGDKYGIGAELIHVESDAAPAIYLNMGQEPNYEGLAAKLKYYSSKYQFNFEVLYTSSKPIEINLYQKDRDVIQVELRKEYDIF